MIKTEILQDEQEDIIFDEEQEEEQEESRFDIRKISEVMLYGSDGTT